jgi:hypothetical protein
VRGPRKNVRRLNPSRFRHIGVRQPLAGEQAWPRLLCIYSPTSCNAAAISSCRM